MYRFIVTFVLFFVTLIAVELRAATVHTFVKSYPTVFKYGTDPVSGDLFLTETCGPHNNFNSNLFVSFTDTDGTTGTAVFVCDGPAVANPARYLLSQFSVVRCRVSFTKVGYLPIYKDFPSLESWAYTGSGLSWRFQSTVEFPNWDDPDDPFGDGGGGGNDPTDTDGDGTPDDDDDDDDNDGTPDVSDPDPEDPDVPGDDNDDDDDPDDDPENACTCGACCSCKCTCGLWSAEICSGTCWHYGHGDTPMPPEVAGGYCECHHQDEDGEEDEECCEHHAAIQEAAERAADASESIDDKLDGIENELSGINDKLTVTDPGNLTLPSLGGGVDVPLPSVPSISAPSLSLPEVGEVSERPLTYFERRGFGELPSFNYAKLYLVLSEAVEDKFGLMSLSNKFNNPSGGGFDLSFTIDFQLPAPFKVHVGPHTVNVRKYINDYASLPIANVIRLILLAYLGLQFIIVTVNIIFLTPW